MRRLGKWLSASVVLASYSGWFVCGSSGAWRESNSVASERATGGGGPARGEYVAAGATAAATALGGPARPAAGSGAGGPEGDVLGPAPPEDRRREAAATARATGSRAASGEGDTAGKSANGDGELARLQPTLGSGGALASAEIPARGAPAARADTSLEKATEPGPALAAADGRLLVWNLSGRSDGSHPWMAGEIGTELEYNSYFAASNPEYERDNWLTNIHLEQELHLSERLSVRSNVRAVLESDGEDERFYSDFPNEGVYLIELLAKYQTEHFSVFGGKYEPAAHIRGYAPIFFGNYSRNLVLDRRLGGGASVTVGNDTVGRHTLTAHLFRMDTTRLRGEIVSDRWRQDEFIDMAGDIGWPSSYLVTLQGTPPGDDANLSYTLGAGEQTRGDRPDERMFMGALFGRVPIEGIGSIEASIDGLHLRNAAGYRENRKVLEPGLGVNTPSFYVGGAYSLRHADPAEEPARVDHIAELVGRYYLSQRSTVEAAYQHVREGGDVENAFGIAIRYWADWLVH